MHVLCYKNRSMKKTIINILAARGISVSHCADVQVVRRLVERLHPVTTEKELIRIGENGDGGYLVPNDLDGIVACFSPGVDVKASFEEALVARGIPCYLADASVERAPVANPLIHFDKKFLGVVDDASTITLDSWVKKYAPAEGDLMLQMDIEGAEWPVLLNVSDQILERFRIIVVELHSLERLIDKFIFELMFATLDRLLRQFCVVHIHPNNVVTPLRVGDLVIPKLLEITLLRRDRSKPTGYARQFPHSLDFKNVANLPDCILPAGWHRTL